MAAVDPPSCTACDRLPGGIFFVLCERMRTATRISFSGSYQRAEWVTVNNKLTQECLELVVRCGMPKRKSAEVPAEPAAVPEPAKKRASASKPKSAAATHKRSSPKKSLMMESAESPVAAAAAVAPATATEQPRTPAHHEIALLAYSYAEARGFTGGSPEEDWFRAERELLKLA